MPSHTVPAGQPLRVTFLTHYAELYGANLSMLNLIGGLREHRVEARVICPDDGDLIPALERLGVPVARMPFEWWVSAKPSLGGALRRYRRNVRLLPAITRQMTEWGTRLVYSNSSVFAIGAMAAARLRTPHIWHLREFGDLDYDLVSDVPYRVRRWVLGRASATVCVSHAIRRHFFGDRPPAAARVVYNGVATAAEFDARKRAAEAAAGRQQPFTFALVGRFRDGKGQAIAIRAFAQVAAITPNVRLLLVGGSGGTGDQAYFDGCRALAAELGVADRVEFWGYIPDPERAFLACDAALMCSRNEAMGRVTAEAMSACRPVIGYDGAGTTELIEHGRTGLLYQGEADALAACMARYVAAPEEASQHGEAAWAAAKQRHTSEVYATHLRDILRRVVAW
jgi:glycosyltransferase involved in cell wall biosynthesis